MRTLYHVVLLLSLLFGPPPAPAHGHASPVRLTPAHGAALSVLPAELQLELSQPAEVSFSYMRLLAEDGRLANDPTLIRQVQPGLLRTPLPPLDAGRYRVQWRVVAIDGHVTEGSLTFDILPGAAPPVLAEPHSVAGVTPAPEAPSGLVPLTLALAGCGLLFALGLRRRIVRQ